MDNFDLGISTALLAINQINADTARRARKRRAAMIAENNKNANNPSSQQDDIQPSNLQPLDSIQIVLPQQEAHAYPPSGARVFPRLDNLGNRPQDIQCPFCKRRTKTRLEQHPSTITILAGVVTGTFCICLAWIPCAAHWAYNKEWYCDYCDMKLASRRYDDPPVIVQALPPVTSQPQYPKEQLQYPKEQQQGPLQKEQDTQGTQQRPQGIQQDPQEKLSTEERQQGQGINDS